MIVGWVGHLFRAASRVLRTPASAGLERVGAELERLERRRAQRPRTSR